MTFLTKFLCNVNNPILKGLYKVQVNIPKCKSYGYSKFRKSPYIYIGTAMLTGWPNNANIPIFPFNIMKNSSNSLAHQSVLSCPNDFIFGTERHCMVLKTVSKFGANRL